MGKVKNKKLCCFLLFFCLFFSVSNSFFVSLKAFSKEVSKPQTNSFNRLDLEDKYLDELEEQASRSFSKEPESLPTSSTPNFSESANSANLNQEQAESRVDSPQPLKTETVVLKGSVERLVPSGTPINLKITAMPMHGQVYLDNWDINQEFIPPKVGDRITSELTKPIFVSGDLVIPKGSKFYGYVSNVIEPKKFGKDGRVELAFEGLQTPKGKFLKFSEQPKNLKKQLTKKQKIMRGVARVGTYAAGGAATGALMATQVTGLLLTTIQPQYIFMTGGGVGLLVGVVASIIQKGKPGRLMPGDQIQVDLQRSLLLPIAEPLKEQEPEHYQIQGLDVQILSKKLVKDDLGKSILVLDLSVQNMVNTPLYGNDFFLLGPYKRVLYPGGMSLLTTKKNPTFVDSFTSKRIEPRQNFTGQIAFEIDFPGFEHFLCLKARRNQSMIYKSSVGSPIEFQQKNKMQNLKQKFFGSGSSPWE